LERTDKMVQRMAKFEVGEWGRKVLIFHERDRESVALRERLFKQVMKGYAMDNEGDDKFLSMARIQLKEKLDALDFLGVGYGGALVGITIVVDRLTGTIGMAVCREPDQFSRRYGRLLALTRLADRLKIKRARRFFKDGVLYLVPITEPLPVGFLDDSVPESQGLVALPDIREELKRAEGKEHGG